MGHRKGDVVQVSVPAGMLELQVIDIDQVD